MNRLPKAGSSRERAAALIIVLAFVVLLTGLAVAYLSRATSDRQVAHSSFNQSNVDQLAQSATDNIIGDLRQEITNGSAPTTINGVTIYTPTLAAYMLPQRSGNPAGAPNLIRRSVRLETIPAPGVASRASAVNSTTDASTNGRYVTLARWNTHYLLPKYNTLNDDSYPPSPLLPPFNPYPAVPGGFMPPDWVFVANNGATVITAPNSSVIGRYAYAVYDEGGLLDMNVAGYPTGTTAAQSGRKGTMAFADLKALGNPILNPDAGGIYQIDRLVGWRNYATTQPANKFPDTQPTGQAFARNFQSDSTRATAYYNSIISSTNGFLSTNGAVAANGRTNQLFLGRQELIAYQKTPNTNAGTPLSNTSQFDVNALQYLGTFLRELNAPSWAPTLNASDMGGNNGAGNIYAYRTNADSPTAINRNLLGVRVTNLFTRADGTTAVVGEPLINRRFPLTRLAGLGPTGIVTTGNSTIINGVPAVATAGTVQRDFGLQWDNTNNRWNYVGAAGSTIQTRIERLDEVAAESREPNFFELLKAAILSGSLGMGSGTGNVPTFVAAEGKYYDTTNNLSSDYQIMQIGANIINQRDSGNVPIFFNFEDSTGNYQFAGIKNLPYLSKLVFKPYWKRQGSTNTFDAWLLPSFWNPHQNAPASAAQNVRLIMTSGTMTANTTLPDGSSSLASPQFMTFDAGTATFGTSPSALTAIVSGQSSASVTKSAENLYYGFHFPTVATTAASNNTTGYPDFGGGCSFELQVQVNGSWKSYQKWTGCVQPATRLVYRSSSNPQNNADLQDPEFVTLDPRTLRFGVWGNDGNDSGAASDYTTGVLTTLDQSVGSPPSTPAYELIPAAVTTLRPNGSMFASASSPNLYFYANNADGTVHYTDLDLVQRRGNVLTSGMTSAMQPADALDRPRMLNDLFQSVAELGQIFRDQPWKTLNFTTAVAGATADSPDAGLLDVFTLHESSMEAGKTALNTRQTTVLTAILSQTTKQLTGASVITSSQRDNIVGALVTLTTAQPMLNKAELVTRLAADPSVTGLGNKEARECVLRAFSDACQTRTWNLLIDVIAQSGRYAPGETDIRKFNVDGEQRYWVHVAIDRFTGQVIDKQIEVVNE